MASPQLRLCHDLRSAATVSPSPDVIFEILSWLPAKSLCRCRCVSKEWRALTSTLAFVATYKSRAEPLLIGMSWSVRGTMTLQLMDTDGTVVQRFPPREWHWMLQASLGDLACISSGYSRHDMQVVDQSTGKVKELLPCSKPANEFASDVAAGVLMYSSCGRAALSGSLKVFRLDTRLICDVLTLGDDDAKWRQVQSPPTMVSQWYYNYSSSAVTVNGALHILSDDHYDVLSFDLDNETWKVIRGPQAGFVGKRNSISIAELNGTLCMARIVQPLVADIWLLSDSDKKLWTKAYSLR